MLPSLSTIPEPTTGYRPQPEQEQTATIPMGVDLGPDHPATLRKQQTPTQPVDDAGDGIFWVMLLIVAGVLLRGVLSLLGPIQSGLPSETLQQLQTRARAITSGSEFNAFPFYDLIAGATLLAGLPGWVMVVFGALLSLAAIPAAYVVGRTLTGRLVPGVLAGALIAVHPAVLATSISLSPTSVALSLLTIGLALICLAAQRSTGHAVGGAILLALAGLTAPLCWVVAIFAAPLAGRLAIGQGPAKAVTHSVLVLLFAVTPIIAFRIAAIGAEPAAIFTEFIAPANTHNRSHEPIAHWLIHMTDPSLAQLGQALNLPLEDAGRLTFNAPAHTDTTQRDIVADTLADGWFIMNTALACMAVISAGVMLMRRRWIEVALLTVPLITLAFCAMPACEMNRLPMIGLLGVLSLGLLATRPIVELDEAALAERSAKRLAKRAAKEEKARQRAEQRANKERAKLYAFEQAAQNDSHEQASHPAATRNENDSAPAGILTERITEESPINARPI